MDRDDHIRALGREHVLYSWSTQGQVDPPVIAGGSGSWFWGHDDRRYLDFASQVVNVNLGHQHPRVVAALREQAERLCAAAPSFASAPRSELARLLAEVTPGDLGATLFTTGGADANENAVKLARRYTGRQKVVARYRSYHGATAGAAALTGDPRRWPAEPSVPGVVHIQGADLEEVLRYEDPRSVAAVILEPIPGANGVLVPPPDFLPWVREVCDRHGILLIFDEVMSGFGRTGRWFACEHWGVTPDIMALAKGLTSGAVPLGAMVVGGKLRGWLQDHELASGLTACGHPLACAAGVAVIEAMRDERLVENAAAMGEVLGDGLREVAARHHCVGEARGLGLLWALELVRQGRRAAHGRGKDGPAGRGNGSGARNVDGGGAGRALEPLVPYGAKGEAERPMAAFRKAAMDLGLYLYTHDNVVLVAPPLVVTGDEVDAGLAALDEALKVADAAAGLPPAE